MPFSRALPAVAVPTLLAVLCLAALHAQEEPVGELFAADASVTGGVLLTGSGAQVLGGSEVRAGDSTAVLRLTRGGDVRICPRTAVSVTSARDGRGLMLAMSTGAMETRYSLPAASDSILTPDFRIALTGPGRFHFAISSDARGNTCVRALPDNTASVIVSELMGSGHYQVKASEQVVFREGGMQRVDSITPADCGCPAPLELRIAEAVAPSPPVAIAQDAPPSAPVEEAPEVLLGEVALGEVALEKMAAPVLPAAAALVPAPPAALRSGRVHVEVDAPFVFRAEEAESALLPAADFLAAQVRLRVPGPPLTTARAPAAAAVRMAPAASGRRPEVREKRGFFRRVGSIFGAIFGR